MMDFFTYGKLSRTFQDLYHGVAIGIMSADFLALSKGKESNAYSIILRQSLAHYLAGKYFYFLG